eukprot:CAMPEP_0113704898 /NCGR_PEP_ID=MMETSP0038_2-20120614/26806_1 /TAXON_ID=2898 /ORGANISM="Cryptomonas paramecium" /LENGTH=144 /DNA_ID=CAMNT_0000629793 /DNA_START=476 /DNA_END=910 /DNA_ORIENTATION=- /assembly_acc=CAM_ASM_000170
MADVSILWLIARPGACASRLFASIWFSSVFSCTFSWHLCQNFGKEHGDPNGVFNEGSGLWKSNVLPAPDYSSRCSASSEGITFSPSQRDEMTWISVVLGWRYPGQCCLSFSVDGLICVCRAWCRMSDQLSGLGMSVNNFQEIGD